MGKEVEGEGYWRGESKDGGGISLPSLGAWRARA